MPDFSHLHVHTQYSLLDGAASIPAMMQKAQQDGMKALAITDHGNMYGAFKFVAEADKHGIIPIVGCEFYMCKDRFDKTDKKRYHQVLLAKNTTGYHNISKLCSLGFIEGYYYHPRIDKDLLLQYKEGIIATTCCLAAEIPRAIIEQGEEEAEKLFKWWLDQFGEDYYIELQRHGIPDQDVCNEVLIKWSKKYNVKMIATNDSHYVNEEDHEAHDILLCLQTGSDINDPKRFKFDNNQFFLKTKEQMAAAFSDVPEALDNTMEIVSKIDPPKLKRDILLPNYSLPEGFTDSNEYLKHLSFQGAKVKYGEISNEVSERLEYELKVINEMGFAGYFLIVQDFIAAAHDLNVGVGPGRGSAAGSAIAYCTGITNIDPIKYNLLFERFLNPERVSMPDIDIDFDDKGRQKVIDYVVDKYGKTQVAQIVTFGTMAAKSSIRDVGRVLQLPLKVTDTLAKMIPEVPGINLETAFKEVKELRELKEGTGDPLTQKTLKFAQVLEGSVRHTGIHAAGVIIAPDDITNHIPVCTSKDSDLYVTQFDGKYIEDAGMLKMDFLGLKTLSILNDAVVEIKQNHGVSIDLDLIPLDDEKTFDLYQKGDTIGTFQFESEGMRQYLKELKPTNIEDLIAMNALYRPGPMDYIPEFINRKHGKSKVEYPHEWLTDLLEPTYGIMVYQEQIMQAARIIGGYSLGSADVLRRAMGKKNEAEMERQSSIFKAGAKEKGIDEKKAEEIFKVMAGFAKYGFNRSHSAAYSILAFQTAYLKAHYPEEYMASVLTHNMNDVKQIYFFQVECNRHKITTLGPDINESNINFAVNEKKEVRFALSAIKGVGEGAVKEIVEERAENGPFTSIFDFTTRVNLRSVNKKAVENLALAGAFDSVGDYHRAQYFAKGDADTLTTVEKAVKYAQNVKESAASNQNSLFGEDSLGELDLPTIPETEPWSAMELMQREKEVTGMYLSGHPLDEYRIDIKSFCNANSESVEDSNGQLVKLAGIITDVQHRVDKRGRGFGIFGVEDYNGSVRFALFSEDYLKYRHFLVENQLVFVKCKYQARYRDATQMELKVLGIELLAEVREKEAKGLTLTIKLSELNQNLINYVEQLIKDHPGNYRLSMNVVDTDENMRVQFYTKNTSLDISNELIAKIQALNGVHYTLN